MGIGGELSIDQFNVLAPDDVIVDRELVLAAGGFPLFRLEGQVAVFGIFGLAELEVAVFAPDGYVLTGVGVGQGEPDTDLLPGGDVLHRERVAKHEVAFLVLG
jgi:hypothetical protein